MNRKAIVLGAILAPWLALAPLGSIATIIAYSIALLASFHGWGITVYRRTDADPLLTVFAGIAAVIVLAGLAIACHQYGPIAQATLVFGGAAIHSTALASRFHLATTRIAHPGSWLLPAGVLAVLAIIQILGAAGDLDTRAFDDDCNVFAQLRRLADTGALADPIGYPRGLQLGGGLGLAALANVVGDAHTIRMLDALGFVLVVAFAIARLRSSPFGPMWATLLCFAAAAFATASADPVVVWIPAGLILALFEVDEVIPAALLAAALIALRLAFLPVALVGVIAASRREPRRMLVIALIALAALAPYVVARLEAWAGVSAVVHAIALPSRGSLAGPLGAFILIAVLATPLVLLVASGLRWHAFATVVGIAAVASHLTGTRYDARFMWPIGAAFIIALAVRLGRASVASVATMIVGLLACLVIHEGQDTPGRLGWYRRTYDLVNNIEYLRHARLGTSPDSDILDSVPRGATIAVWVTRPEQLDYREHRIVDLRTPRLAALRARRASPRAPQFELLLGELHARYLLVEDDDAVEQRRWQNAFEYFICPPHAASFCADGLESISLRHRVIAARDGFRLVDLAAP